MYGYQQTVCPLGERTLCQVVAQRLWISSLVCDMDHLTSVGGGNSSTQSDPLFVNDPQCTNRQGASPTEGLEISSFGDNR